MEKDAEATDTLTPRGPPYHTGRQMKIPCSGTALPLVVMNVTEPSQQPVAQLVSLFNPTSGDRGEIQFR
jgi:hypothetical protein